VQTLIGWLAALFLALSGCASDDARTTGAGSVSSERSAAPGAGDVVTFRSPDQALAAGNSWRITGVGLFDGDRWIDRATVVITAGWIRQVCVGDDAACASTGGPSIDGTGKFLMPALIDAEGHFGRPREMLPELLSADAPMCAGDARGRGRVVRPSSFELAQAFARSNLLTEVDTHGLVMANPARPRTLGARYPISDTANYEKHVRFGVTTVLDMAAYPWPANYVRRSRDQWRGGSAPPAADLQKEFLVYADLFTSGMWAAPAGLQFAFYGMDPVYNIQPDGPWSEGDVRSWIARRVVEGSDHIKVFYETCCGAQARRLTAPTLQSLVQAAHERGLQVYVHNESESASEDVMRSGADANIHAPGLYDVKRDAIGDDFAERFARAIGVVVPTMTGMLQGCDNPYALANRRTHALSATAPGASFVATYVESADVLPYLNALDELRIGACGGRADFERVLRNTAKLYDHGVTLLVGTDAFGLEPLIEGLGTHYEAYLIREALDRYSRRAHGREATLAALKAATSNAARAYGLHIENGHHPRADPRGFVKPGYRADLLLLRQSPMEQMLNTLRIDSVFKAGYLANRQMVRPECASGDCESRRIVRKLEAQPCAAPASSSVGDG
jgi:imidazolonepropionase-like amidohydrolase